MTHHAKSQRSQQGGFTLIELLIVITIIGILASIALPKFGKTRERAHFKAMMSDLRNLESQEEIYRGRPTSNYEYAAALTDLPDYNSSAGVTISILGAGTTGWAATSSHASLASNQLCAVFAGTVGAVPSPAATPGVVACTGE